MLQLRQSECVPGDAASLATLRQSFERDGAVRLPNLFDAELVRFAQRHIRQASFFDRDDQIGREACMHDNALIGLLNLVMNDDRVFDAVRSITGCPPPGMFLGRVFRMHAVEGHRDRWHSDVDDNRLIGVSVNLTEEVFSGGVFQLRRIENDGPHWSIANIHPGDGVLFAIGDHLRHRVTPVDGSVPRVAYAGWFQKQPNFLSLLKSAASSREATPIG